MSKSKWKHLHTGRRLVFGLSQPHKGRDPLTRQGGSTLWMAAVPACGEIKQCLDSGKARCDFNIPEVGLGRQRTLKKENSCSMWKKKEGKNKQLLLCLSAQSGFPFWHWGVRVGGGVSAKNQKAVPHDFNRWWQTFDNFYPTNSRSVGFMKKYLTSTELCDRCIVSSNLVKDSLTLMF